MGVKYIPCDMPPDCPVVVAVTATEDPTNGPGDDANGRRLADEAEYSTPGSILANGSRKDDIDNI